jgi:hypothetical protein
LAGWDALPSETLTKIKAIKADPLLTPVQKLGQIDTVMAEIPIDIDKIPDPPIFEHIPENVSP